MAQLISARRARRLVRSRADDRARSQGRFRRCSSLVVRLVGRARRHARGHLGEDQGPPLLLRGGAPLLRPHARRGGARLQHPVQLLQSKVRLRQREPPGVVSERADAEQARRSHHGRERGAAALGPRIAGPGDACYDWRKSKATFEAVSRDIRTSSSAISTNGLALPDQRRRARGHERRPRHDHHQHGRSRDRRADLPLDLLPEPALDSASRPSRICTSARSSASRC